MRPGSNLIGQICALIMIGCSITREETLCRYPLGFSSGGIPDEAITTSCTILKKGERYFGDRMWCPSKNSKSYLQIDLGKLHIITMVKMVAQLLKRDEEHVVSPPIIGRQIRLILTSSALGYLDGCLHLEIYGCLSNYKNCMGIPDSDFLHYENIERFRSCTIVYGNIKISRASFDGDTQLGIKGIKVADLQMLKDIKEIIGFLSIQEAPPEVKALSFLSGLEIIHGEVLSKGSAISIISTDIEWLGLKYLKQVQNGNITIVWNRKLCYIANIDFRPIILFPTQHLHLEGNKDKNECDARGLTCDSRCSHHGCWGPGLENCLHCENITFIKNTSNSCPQPCHDECIGGCNGPGPEQCVRCRNVAIIETPKLRCLSDCPLYWYSDRSRLCRRCHPLCARGCTGPYTTPGSSGCNDCYLMQVDRDGSMRCLTRNLQCPRGYFREWRVHVQKSYEVCVQCDRRCQDCYGPKNTDCRECRYFHTKDGACVDVCPVNTVLINKSACLEKCPEHSPVLSRDPTNSNVAICIPHHDDTTLEKGESYMYILAVLALLVLPSCATLVVAPLCSIWRRKKLKKVSKWTKPLELKTLEEMFVPTEEKQRKSMLQGLLKMFSFKFQPLHPTDAKPDLSKLKIIKESELRRGGVIGSGVFGMVYKGFWVPERENVKIPVAIKVLKEGTSPDLNQELLEEARVMASVEHPYCLRLLAVCMCSEMMMISQLMPLGCILGYIRKHRSSIGSKSFLNYCTQIAMGMAYLEERGIVHRDLAARNILVRTAAHVKITDFGLAKLLNYNKDEYYSSGGKVPVKWLAPESIQYRTYSHKSDVWSYGVTLWELFTYGKRPYETVKVRDILDLLMKGERLPQPDMCTIDVYMIMIKCWMNSANGRPSFKDLAEEFARMARDPGRYLVIQGDTMMKMPTPSAETDILQLCEGEEGPEKLIEAEEYLRLAPPAPPVPLTVDIPKGSSQMVVHIPVDKYGYLQPGASSRAKYLNLENTDENRKPISEEDKDTQCNGNATDPVSAITLNGGDGYMSTKSSPARCIDLENNKGE